MRPSWTRQKAIRDLARHPRTLALAFARHPAAPAQGIRRGRSPARQMIFDIVGDLLADGRQLKQLVLDDRIVGLLGTLPVHGRLIPEIVRPIHTGTIPG